jgi:hypothetical protein|tara:strand:- start:620 stop:721 length:102 start_codon:yes stop_codon:yes gene_type:complete
MPRTVKKILYKSLDESAILDKVKFKNPNVLGVK